MSQTLWFIHLRAQGPHKGDDHPAYTDHWALPSLTIPYDPIRSLCYVAPCLWYELPTDLRQPRQTQSPSLSPPITHGRSSSSQSLLSPVSSSLTHSVIYSELRT